MARPTLYTEERANEILNLYASGDTLLKVEKKKNLPSRRTIYQWRKDHPEFGKAFDIAIQCHTDQKVEEAEQIADTEEDAKKAKNRIDIRLWKASKMNRPVYGESFQLDIKQTVDISPALALAFKKMKEIGTGSRPEPEQIKKAEITPQ